MKLTTRVHAPLALAALLLPLLAACGGAPAAPAATFAPAATSAPAAPAATSAPAATAAPAATTSPAAAATAAPAAATAPTAAPAAAREGGANPPSGDTAGVAPAPRPIQQQQLPALKAGEVDDNADFNEYLRYLYNYSGPQARPVDVSERLILTVVNSDRKPVLDARVRIFAGQQQVFVGRTTSGGRTIFHPRAAGVSDQSRDLRVRVEKGNASAESVIGRDQGVSQTIVLPDAPPPAQRQRLDVLFLLDATGSMGDEIGRIQVTIVSIADRIAAIQPQPELRFGLVAYRDRGDEYVTRVSDFTGNVQTFQQTLLQVRADGGGDTPESLNAGLHDAVEGVNWADDALRLVFLVADAPPHLDYAQDYDYVQETRVAVSKGVKVFPIAASNSDEQSEYIFRQLAQQTLGSFIFLTYQPGMNSGSPGDTTTKQVDPAAFTVERLDDLVVQIVKREIAAATAAG